jgi:D-psicose/D-tagatose/L-ribulose 3-epimerase
MKYGVNTWVWSAPLTTKELKIIAPRAAKMGFDHLELPIHDTAEIDFKECRRIINAAGIDSVSFCALMTPARDLIDPNPLVRHNGVAYLKACVDGLAEMGGGNLVGNLYSAVGRLWQQSPEERERDISDLVVILRDVSTYASNNGVVLGVEPLNRYETSFITSADQANELIDRVNHPACKILLDTFHMNMEESSISDAIRKVGKSLLEVHSIENHRGTPGTGSLRWDEIAAALKGIEFDGVLVMESFSFDEKKLAKDAAIWRPLAASPDALAADGIAFLKKIMK